MEKDIAKFIKRISIFLIILILSSLLIQVVYEKIVVEKKIFSRKEVILYNYINNVSDKEIFFAFFGDSHLLNAINPKFIPNSFNLATSGATNLDIYYQFKTMIESGIKIKNVLLEIDLHTFSKRPGQFKKDIPEYYCKIIPYFEIKRNYNSSFFSYLTCKYDLFFGGGGDIVTRIIAPKTIFISDRGWIPFERDSKLGPKEKGLELARRYKGHFESSLEIDINSLEFIYFNKTIDLAKKNNISIILVEYPVSKEYETYAIERNISKENYYRTLFRLVNSTIGNDYTVLDYSQYFFNHTEYFADPNHLNIIGAEIFSKKINKDVKEYERKNYPERAPLSLTKTYQI